MEGKQQDETAEPNVIATKEQDGGTVRYGLFERGSDESGPRTFRLLDGGDGTAAPERTWDELELDGFGFTANYPEVRAYRERQKKGGMTTREKRERRADRRRGWAEGREAKADAAHQAAHDATAGIPFGQPILVGHHSEGKHRRAVERGQRQASKAVEHSDMAKRHQQAAETIERQLDASIYDDDPDAIERLRERIEQRETKRAEMKSANAAYRKQHRAELKGMTAYERDQSVPFPGWALSNLGGCISRDKKRLARLERSQ
jgi:Domain of unknown function (DUF3560)